MLSVRNLEAWYGHTQVLFDVNFDVEPGQVVALVGSNGAGKTTTVRSLLGMIKTKGQIDIENQSVMKLSTSRRVRKHRIAVVHEGRGLFFGLNVRENLLLGLERTEKSRLDKVFDLFPDLSPRLDDEVSLLSGGQQQMVAIGRTILRDPDYLFLDEPSLGLSPGMSKLIFSKIAQLCESGMGVLVIDQNVPELIGLSQKLIPITLGATSEAQTVDESTNKDFIKQFFEFQQ